MKSFAEFSALCQDLEGITGKKEKIRIVGEFLKESSPEEAQITVYLLLGKLPEGKKTFVSGRTLFSLLDEILLTSPRDYHEIRDEAIDAGETVRLLYERRSRYTSRGLSLQEVYSHLLMLGDLRGQGVERKRKAILRNLFARMDALEAKHLAKILLGEMRIGVQEGMLLESIAYATSLPLALIRRAFLLWGDVGRIAYVAKKEGLKGLETSSPRLFQPLQPMLVQTASSLEEVYEEMERFALEFKYDGARVQIHKRGEEVRIFSRRLKELTPALPEVVEEVKRELKGDGIVEGEVVAMKEGRVLPFQMVMQRLTRKHDIEGMAKEIPLKLYLFDCLLWDGESLIDKPYEDRWEVLERIRGNIALADRLIPRDLEEARSFYERAIAEGQEGVMAKALKGVYTPGNRGKLWLKVKKAITLDLVIIGAEWGYGRRHNWLSDYHLACWDEERKELLMLGKTFKGLTDEEFEEMTRRLLELKIREEGGVVYVKPEIVVEIAFGDIQKSPRYKCGYALRFARITRIREDKTVEEIDDISLVRRIYEASLSASQF